MERARLSVIALIGFVALLATGGASVEDAISRIREAAGAH